MEEKAVHESLSIRGSVGRLSGLLEHHTYRDWEDQRKRSERYARLWADQRKQQGRGRQPAPLEPELRAAWRFFRGYCLKRGLLDGPLGFRIARANAGETLRKYRLLRAGRQRTEETKGT